MRGSVINGNLRKGRLTKISSKGPMVVAYEAAFNAQNTFYDVSNGEEAESRFKPPPICS